VIIALRQDDGSVERLSTDDLSALEAAAIEEAMGDVPWRAIEDRLRAQDPTAMRAVLWAFRRREEPGLEFGTYDVPGWRRRLTARIERAEIDEVLTNLMTEAMAKNEDSMIDAITPHLRKLADNRDDVDQALDALGKGHLVKGRQGSED